MLCSRGAWLPHFGHLDRSWWHFNACCFRSAVDERQCIAPIAKPRITTFLIDVPRNCWQAARQFSTHFTWQDWLAMLKQLLYASFAHLLVGVGLIPSLPAMPQAVVLVMRRRQCQWMNILSRASVSQHCNQTPTSLSLDSLVFFLCATLHSANVRGLWAFSAVVAAAKSIVVSFACPVVCYKSFQSHHGLCLVKGRRSYV